MNTPYHLDNLQTPQPQHRILAAEQRQRIQQELEGIVEGEPYLPPQEQEHQ